MSTALRPELTRRNPYWIDRHRYYELKHFCLQYPRWRRIYASLSGYSSVSTSVTQAPAAEHIFADPTAQTAENRLFYADRMRMVEDTATATGGELGVYILRGVTEGLSYEHLRALTNIPCGKETYYQLYRRFFYLLDKVRQ